jgi:hypothetical protein
MPATPKFNQSAIKTYDLTIASGTTSTSITDGDASGVAGRTVIGLVTPAGIASTSVTFNVLPNISNSGHVTLKDKDGADYSVTVEASKQYYLDPVIFAGVLDLQIQASSSETNKTFTIITRNIT